MRCTHGRARVWRASLWCLLFVLCAHGATCLDEVSSPLGLRSPTAKVLNFDNMSNTKIMLELVPVLMNLFLQYIWLRIIPEDQSYLISVLGPLVNTFVKM